MSETDAEFVEIMMQDGDWQPGSRMHRLAILARRGADAAARIEQLEAALRAAYEAYAGSDGFVPETCAEGYQRQIITQMVGCISAALGEERT
jgi:hypothetical protein